jgi:G3E family GTPase
MTAIPLTILGGYLGAGKTTLINKLLAHMPAQNEQAPRFTVLVNDFGAINIDAGLIADHQGDTISLTNGCACCQLQDNVLAQLTALSEQENRPDHILIEASGAGEPARLAYLGYGSPGIRLEAVPVAVDALSLSQKLKDKFVGGLVRRQIEQADILIATKTDLPDADLPAIRTRLESLSDAPIWDAAQGLHALIAPVPKTAYRSEPVLAAPLSTMPSAAIFDQLSFRSDNALPVKGLTQLLHRYAPLLERAKGHSGSHRLQLAGHRFTLGAADKRPAELVFIALKGRCDLKALEKDLQQLAGQVRPASARAS